MTSIFVFLSVTFIVLATSYNIYQIIVQKVTFKKYNPYRKIIVVALFSLPWLFLFFPFTLDWNTYWSLVLVRLPFTIIWFVLTIIGLYFDIRLNRK